MIDYNAHFSIINLNRMAIYKIVHIPDTVLRKEAETVTVIDDSVRKLVDDMFETMYHANGVGLAAPQIGISKRIAVIDATQDKRQQLCLINPEITHREGSEVMQEGCLSVPGTYDAVQRATKVTMKATDQYGKDYELTAEGLLAEVIQHEIDHLYGKLYIDLLSPLKRDRAKEKMDKHKRLAKK